MSIPKNSYFHEDDHADRLYKAQLRREAQRTDKEQDAPNLQKVAGLLDDALHMLDDSDAWDSDTTREVIEEARRLLP